jgi:hypothetical protein
VAVVSVTRANVSGAAGVLRPVATMPPGASCAPSSSPSSHGALRPAARRRRSMLTTSSACASDLTFDWFGRTFAACVTRTTRSGPRATTDRSVAHPGGREISKADRSGTASKENSQPHVPGSDRFLVR